MKSVRRDALVLWLLLALFVLRVAGQAAVGLGYDAFLPSWEEWFSGVVTYPALLASQLAIMALLGKVSVDFTRNTGWFARPRAGLGGALLAVGFIYLAVMVIRYALRMTLYPSERWTGGSIPIFFHWVLASFVLVVGFSYKRRAPREASGRHSLRRAAKGIFWALVVVTGLTWTGYQIAPTILARTLGAQPAEHAIRVERRVEMEATDGVVLRADVYHPVRTQKTPTLLVRIPFSKTLTNRLFADIVGRFWSERGYTVVIQGTRGRYDSEGHHTPLIDERRDGLDTLAWLKRQSWFDGRLGMWGGSAFGYTQWSIVDQLPPTSALMIQISSTSFYDMFYPGGAFSLSSALFWAVRSHAAEDVSPDVEAVARGAQALPPSDADRKAVGQEIPFFNDWIAHRERDDFWRGLDGDDRAGRLRAPVLLTAGWFDPFLPSQLADFARIQKNGDTQTASGSRLVIGPWAHAETAALPGGIQNRNYRLETLAPTIGWFDHHLRRRPATESAPVRLYVMGANIWRDERTWPPADARETFWYLRSGGRANSASGDGLLVEEEPMAAEPSDVFVSDPANPVPTRGGSALGFGAGVVAQHDVARRDDVLVYTTAPLTEELEVTGPVAVDLYVQSSTPSADFTAKLVDVHATGEAYNVSDGILRRAYEPVSAPGRAAAGLARIRVELWPTSMLFRRGHRIRLEIAGSNFPRFDRNLHAGNTTSGSMLSARQSVHHGAGAASRLVLSVVRRQVGS